jgi:formate dehydrogenase major subunit
MTNPINDLANSNCIFVIGSNFAENHPIVARWVMDAKQRGATLILADPRYTQTAWASDIFLPLMPGSDISLLNAMMNVIVEEKIYNQKFIEARTTGFDELCKTVEKYSPARAEKLTGVPAEKIIRAARSYANAAASSIVYCMGVTQHISGTATVTACADLAMLCGHVGRPGTGVNPLRGQDNVQGACDMGALPNVYPAYQPVIDTVNRDKFAAAWNIPAEKLSTKVGLTLVEMTHAIERDEMHGMLIMGENPVVGDPNSSHVSRALEKIDFLAVMDIFMTESAQLADVVLPAASFAEKFGTKTTTDRRVQWLERAIQPVGESRADWRIISEIANRLGLNFHYRDEVEILNEIRKVTPSYAGIAAERIQNKPGGIHWPCPNEEHPGTPILYTEKFSKPDGRGIMKPVEHVVPAEPTSDEYPLVLTSGRVVMHYNSGSMTRRSKALLDREPEIFVQINPDTAREFGVAADENAQVKTRRGCVQAKVRVSRRIPPGVLFMPYHFPAMNQLTIDALDPTAKIPEYKVAACRIEPLEKNIVVADLSAQKEAV